MILPIVNYGHPVLRQKGSPITEVTEPIRTLIGDMLETMYDAQGIGLAAQQVGVPLQLAVIDVTGATDRPSFMTIDGIPADVASLMPLVLINPELTPGEEKIPGPEGCLSFPEIFTDIIRPAEVLVKALDEKGRPRTFHCGGLLARAIQHETDHLQGILFIDRMPLAAREGFQPELDALQADTRAELNANR